MSSIGSSLGELYSKCVQLVNENKISTKNAFELPLIEHMDDIVDSFMGGRKAPKSKEKEKVRKSTPAEAEMESRFHEASCTIEASARIYACRVDCVHTDTYRVLGGLNTAEAEEQQPGEDGKAVKKRRICGVNTLEKNEANLVQQHIEADEQSDPMFRRMAAAFDAGGAKGLLLSHLPLAEDMSLVFNGDVPCRAESCAMTGAVRTEALNLGAQATSKIEESRLCPEVDSFRRQLWGNNSFTMPKALEDLLGVAVSGPGTETLACARPDVRPVAETMDLPEVPGFEADSIMGDPPSSTEGPKASPRALPLVDLSASQVLAAPASSKDDVVAFDELFEKFCGAGSNQFAYFDECWSKLAKEKTSEAQAIEKEHKERQPKKPLFDVTNMDKAAKPIETEPVGKHQMNEKASQWQLRKDVPPYMIDRITMPSWQTWSKVDFACLGLRPHLMLKLVRKPPPETEGPHGFSELFSTVVVENNEAFPWLASEKSSRRDEDLEGEEDGGLPGHLEVDPQELFLAPDDKVLPGADDLEDDLAGSFMANGLDFELAEKPTSAENVDIAYSRNSKFVDVKLVKKHLWGCLEKDLGKKAKETHTFQDLVSKTVTAMPKGECENLSAAVCFICALHLCNEKNLELQTDPAKPLGDFSIVPS